MSSTPKGATGSVRPGHLKAMRLHSCFGEDGRLQVFDVWESQEAFDEFLTYLGPVMEELGIELAQPPTIMPIVDLVQQ